MLKFAGGLLLSVCGILTGIYLGEKLKTRTLFYEQYIRFLTQAQTMIGYTASSIRTVLEETKELPLMKPVITDTLAGLDNGKSFEQAWKYAVVKNIHNNDDRKLLLYFGAVFGTSDISGELAKISLQKENSQHRLGELKEDLKTKKRLYRTVGMFCGVLAAVVML